MICRSCGREINDGAKFCPYCGMDPSVPVGTGSSWSSPPAPTGPAGLEAPVSGTGKGKKGLLIGLAVAAVAVAVGVAVGVSGLFSNPKSQVEKAMAKSAAAYAAAEEKLELPDIEQWQRDKLLGQQFNLKLTGINSDLIGYDLSALEGLGLHLDADYNLDARVLSCEMGAYWGEDDLLSFSMAAEDDKLYFSSPQFTGETYYGVNTETLGADLTRMTGNDSIGSVSFNLFDLMDTVLEQTDQENLEQDMKGANKALWEAAQVKKEGAKTLSFNGTEAKTAAYRVIFPQEALHQYVDALETTLSLINYFDLYEELYRSMGMPQDQIDEILDMLEDLDIYGQLADVLRDAVDELGDLELEVCLSGGYVSALLYEDKINGTDISLALYLGGGREYVDDLSAELKADDIEITLKSSGDHGLKDGAYTDETTVRVKQSGTSVAKIASELSYDPKADRDNFQWDLEANSSGLSLFTLEAAGSLTAEERSVALNLDDISLRVMGMEVCNLSFEYKIRRGPEQMTFGDTRLITDMSMEELTALAVQIQTNAETWVEDMQDLFLTRLPQELLYGMM